MKKLTLSFVLGILLCPLIARGQFEQPRTQSELLEVIEGKTTTLFDAAKAFQELAIVGDASVAPRVARFLKVPEMSTYVLSALQRIPGEEVDRVLLSELEQLEGSVRAGILHTLGERRAESAIKSVEKYAREGSDLETRLAAIRALGRIGGEKAKSTLKRYRNSSGALRDKRVLDAAIAEAYDGEPSMGRIQYLILSKRPEQVREAFSMARQLGKKANKLMQAQLRTKSRSHQLTAIMFLGDHGDASHSGKLIPFLESSDSELVLRAFQSLVKLGHYDSSLHLPFATLSNATIGSEAATYLASVDNAELEKAAVKVLSSAATHPDDDTILLQSLINYAARRRIAEATNPLLAIVKASDGELQTRAFTAIGSTVSAEQFPGLLKEIGSLKRPEETRVVLETACSRLPQQSTALAIEQALQTASAEELSMMFHLRTLGGPDALRIVADAAKSRNEQRVDIATQVLGEWMTADVADVLLPLIRTLEGKYQLRALRGYLRVGRQLDMSDTERLKLCQTGYALADRDDEKMLVLDILRRRPSKAGYEWLQELAKDETAAPTKLKSKQEAVISILAERYKS